jgi:hypothetical protein
MRLDLTPEEISTQVKTASAAAGGFPTPSAGERPAPKTIIEKLPLRDALRKYPQVGEQDITGGQLKISHFEKPVRPSVKNWIFDYTSQLGREQHDSMQRMKYLFSSANGNNLSSPEREKLGIILKSFDENIPLSIDVGRNEIVFDFMERGTLPTGRQAWNVEQKPSSVRPQSMPKQIPAPPVGGQSPKTQISKPQQSFVKPYTKNYETPKSSSPAKPLVQNKIPDAKYQMPNTKMQFTNPYPKPITHEPQLAKPIENISNLRFNEGLPQKPAAPQKPPAKPQTKAPLPYHRHPKNIIEPISRPEPKIDGNIVDLSANKEQ